MPHEQQTVHLLDIRWQNANLPRGVPRKLRQQQSPLSLLVRLERAQLGRRRTADRCVTPGSARPPADHRHLARCLQGRVEQIERGFLGVETIGERERQSDDMSVGLRADGRVPQPGSLVRRRARLPGRLRRGAMHSVDLLATVRRSRRHRSGASLERRGGGVLLALLPDETIQRPAVQVAAEGEQEGEIRERGDREPQPTLREGRPRLLTSDLATRSSALGDRDPVRRRLGYERLTIAQTVFYLVCTKARSTLRSPISVTSNVFNNFTISNSL